MIFTIITIICNLACINTLTQSGFNCVSSLASSGFPSIRIGILANNENDCSSVDSWIGFGYDGYPYTFLPNHWLVCCLAYMHVLMVHRKHVPEVSHRN